MGKMEYIFTTPSSGSAPVPVASSHSTSFSLYPNKPPHLGLLTKDEDEFTLDYHVIDHTQASLGGNSENQFDLTIDLPQDTSYSLSDVGQKLLIPSGTIQAAPVAKNLSSYDEMPSKSNVAIAILTSLITYMSVNSLMRHLNPNAFIWSDEDREEGAWMSSSTSWLDRKACRWLGLCGIHHMHGVNSIFGKNIKSKDQAKLVEEEVFDWQNAWIDEKSRPEDWNNDERVLREIPQYVLDYAPLVHLYSGEEFWPCDIAEHLFHITPRLNYTPIGSESQNPNLTNLNDLNRWENGRFVFLTSNDNVEDRPSWLGGERNIPQPRHGKPDDEDDEAWAEWDGRIDGDLPTDDPEDRDGWYDVGQGGTHETGGDRPNLAPDDYIIPAATPEGEQLVDELHRRTNHRGRGKRARGGRSDAPAVLVVVDKGHGVVDAFWFYFYSYNLGNVVLNVRFGNHVGDWEHSLVRFKDGVPKAIFFSEHNFGEAYSYEAVEKIGKRPVIYSATGTHAMYATAGTHSYVLPWGLLHDETDRGPLWDPLLNAHSYTYDYLDDSLRASNVTPHAPTEWFYFSGHWGDKYYPLSDSRQYRFAGQYHYVNGPLGPRFKNLGRRKVCQGGAHEPCVIKNWIGGESRLKRWPAPVPGEPGDTVGEENHQRFYGSDDGQSP